MAAVPSTGEFAKEKREQTIRDMVIAKKTGRQVYFYFAHSANSEASAKIVEQLTRYAERIGVTGIVEIAGNKQPLNYV